MFLKILSHPVLAGLHFHRPMVVDLSHPLVLLAGEDGWGKSTLLQSIFYAMRGEQADGYAYRWEKKIDASNVFLFDAEQHNPRMHLELFENQPETREFVRTASHGQLMLELFRETFPALPDGTMLLLDEPEVALSVSNQRSVLNTLMELAGKRRFRIVCATHSAVLVEAPETCVINLDRDIARNAAGPAAIQ